MSLAAYASETNEKHTRRHHKDGMQTYRFLSAKWQWKTTLLHVKICITW